MLDYSKAAKLLGVEEAAVKAVASVESAGDGLIKDAGGNDVPKILFERHIMFKRLRDLTPLKSADLMAKHPDIVNSTPGGYKGGIAEWGRLNQAIAIDKKTALESASYGAFQIMGFHWQLLGFKSVQEMVDVAYTEQGQLDLFVLFIKANPNLKNALFRKDWASFAKGYNGSNYHINKYDLKMKEAYERFSKS